jgi:hypothetical protein
VVHEQVIAGEARRKPASHFNKATKGRLVRALMSGGVRVRSVDALVTAMRDLKFTVEEAPAAGGARQLDLVVADL